MRCEEQTVDKLAAPQFLQISVQDKTITATRPSGAAVNAQIDLVQGIEKTRGWSMAINQAKGNVSLAIHDDASS